jgi:D-amino-acid dehydrogenase
MPGMFLKSIQWMFDRDSPLYIKPRPSLALVRWLARFTACMNDRHMIRSVEALVPLANYSLEAFSELDLELGGDASGSGPFAFTQSGMLAVARTRPGLHALHHKAALAGAHHVRSQRLTADETRNLEPALTAPDIAGGVLFPDEAHVEPLLAVRALADRAARHGAAILPGVEAFDFITDTQTRRVTAVRTTRGDIAANRVVLAGGVWSNRLARRLGLRVPVLGGKGYALIIDPITPAPRRPLLLFETRVAVTPRADSLRLAGTLELVGEDESITPRRLAAILDAARRDLPVPDAPRIRETWRGLRPCTPDGLPVIGPAPSLDNLYLATGHQMLGLLTAPGTARLLADQMLGPRDSWSLDGDMFNPARF